MRCILSAVRKRETWTTQNDEKVEQSVDCSLDLVTCSGSDMRFARFSLWFIFRDFVAHVYLLSFAPPPPPRPHYMARLTPRATLALHIISLGELLAR